MQESEINTESEFEEVLTLNTKISKNWIKRVFKKMDKGSLRGAILILLVSTLGAGPLSFMHPLKSIGLINCIIITFLVMFCYILCVEILIFAHNKAPEAQTLNEIIEITGGKYLRKLYDILFCIFLYVVLIAIILCISKLIYYNFGKIIFNLFSISVENQNFENINFVLTFIIAFIIFLILLRKSLDGYQKIALYCFGIYLFIVFLIIFQSPFYYQEIKKNDQNYFNYFQCTWKSFFQNFGIICYTFNCTPNFYEISNSILNPSPKRILKIFKLTLFLFFLFLLVIGIVSYLSLGNLAQNIDLIIFRESIGNSDNFMIFGRSILIFNFLLAGALNTYPLKKYISSFSRKFKFKDHLISFLICFSAAFIASFFTKIVNYFSFAGSLTCMISCFTIPGIIAIKTGYCETTLKKGLLYIWVILMTILSVLCSLFSFLQFFE